MTIGSFVGVLGMLGLVLGLLVLTLRLLKRYAPIGASANARIPLEVVQRLAVGPRQGIAIVRLGEQYVAVSIGDGGVRTLLELDAPAHAAPVPVMTPTTPAPGAFGGALRQAIRQSTGLALVIAVAAASARAQGAPAKPAPATDSSQANSLPAKPSAPAAKRAPAKAAPARAATAKSASVPVSNARADTMLTKLAPRIDLRVGESNGGLRLSGTVGVVVMMGLLTLLPTAVLMMTGFTRIFIVLHFLRQAMGTQSAPPTQLIAALALILTGFVMAPTLAEVNRTALEPWMDGKIEQGAMLAEGVKPFRAFMLHQVRERDLATFMDLSRQPRVASAADVPLVVLVSAFATSELRIAFQIGFALFLPFVVIDVVVASVLMSMGMMMLPPVMVSLPFKLLLFVLVDGWSLLVQGLVQSFR
ncbi:MAG: flagellar type III secretion system pore protein FliP [Gemmatimonadetes bacterium]|nr:flagellar type III secretion system pore protein FliP [Gemmatimonadota bacterium]MBI3568662.1 flagellar type III secretion system pore protein FliP [Gemmatimonadota bacterium]